MKAAQPRDRSLNQGVLCISQDLIIWLVIVDFAISTALQTVCTNISPDRLTLDTLLSVCAVAGSFQSKAATVRAGNIFNVQFHHFDPVDVRLLGR